MQKVCIIIPCYNEQYRIPIKDYIESYNNSIFYYLFVNDGSSDLTIDVLNEFMNGRENRVSILDYKINQGTSKAVRLGVLAALKRNEFSIIGYVDADLATPLNEILKITNQINDDVKFVFGSRIKRIGANIKRKWYRHILGRIFATIASKMLKIGVYDTQCGAKFFHKSIVEPLFLEKFRSKWIFDLEIFLRLINLFNNKDINKIAKEIPLQNWADVSGSKLKLLHLTKIPFEMFKLRKH